jgi:DNA-directed RNA polymerase specialized sigma24 family protein/CheY-like chemotaxis protein
VGTQRMAISEEILPHLPSLRRLARALTGSQNSGDSYVMAALQVLLDDPSALAKDMPPKIGLFQLLCGLWSSLDINKRSDVMVAGAASTMETTVQGRLANISGMAREVFLLSAVEGFSTAEIAQIVKMPEMDVQNLKEQALKEISEMIACNVMIIEDEPLIALDIEDIVTSMGHRCVGVARTRSEAVKLAALHKPNLILSDVQLADNSSGIDAVQDILAKMSIPIIFITAFPERLLTGERPEPAFLISKPFSAEMVKAVIAQALFFDVKSAAA